MKEKIEIFLNNVLPEQYRNPSALSGEVPVKDVTELCFLYNNKYGSFGEVVFYIFDEKDMIPFIKGLNNLFASQGDDVRVDARLLKEKIDIFTPMIVVNGEIISRGIYPDLTSLRGGSNSVSRGGSGEHYHSD